METHDINDRKFWREYCKKYGMNPDFVVPEEDDPRDSRDRDDSKKVRKRGGFTPFVSIGITFRKD